MTQPAPKGVSPAAEVAAKRSRRLIAAAALALAVFGGFVAYAYLAQTTYQVSTEVQLDVPQKYDGTLYPIADRRQRLEKAILGKGALKMVAKAMGISTPDGRLELARNLSHNTTLETTDGRSFEIVCTNSKAERAHAICQALARLAAAELPEAATHHDTADRGQKKKVEELLEFLSQHPELSSTGGPDPQNTVTTPKQQPASDPLLNALTNQRKVAADELKELEAVDPDNPYADDLKQELARAKQRLAAIDSAIAKRRSGLEVSTKQVEHNEDALAQLSERLSKLAEAEQSVPAPTVHLSAHVTREAVVPSAPIVPNRTRLLILGALAALGVGIIGVGFAFVARPRQQLQGSAPPRPSPPTPGPELADTVAARTEPSAPPPEHDTRAVAGTHDASGAESAVPRQSQNPEPTDQAVQLAGSSPNSPEPKAEAIPAQGSGTAQPVAHAANVVDEAEAPRTQVGGFETSLSLPEPEPSRPGNPISVKNLVALEASGESARPPEDQAPRTLVGGIEQPDRRSDAPAKASSYTPPKRNITRRLGSLSWLDQAELSRSPASPVSTRYSYVSSRPPPPDAEDREPSPPEVIEAHAEPAGQEPPHDAPPAGAKGTSRHPAPLGWRLDTALLTATSEDLTRQLLDTPGRCRVIGVTATHTLAPGKAKIAASLGFRLAQQDGPRVLLMEGDFQDPVVHRMTRVEMPMSAGFSQQLQQRLLQPSSKDSTWDVVQCLPTLDVLAEGFMRSPGAILSQQFERCVEEMRDYYDVIVIDGPPLGSSSECRAFADVVDGVVICTPRDRPDVQANARSLLGNAFIVSWPDPG